MVLFGWFEEQACLHAGAIVTGNRDSSFVLYDGR